MTLSETAAGTLSFLRTVGNGGACENCLAAYLGIDRYAVLKSIRELVQVGRILCIYTDCDICHERRLVGHLRGSRA